MVADYCSCFAFTMNQRLLFVNIIGMSVVAKLQNIFSLIIRSFMSTLIFFYFIFSPFCLSLLLSFVLFSGFL